MGRRWFGHDLFPFTGRGGRRVAGRRCDGGRDAPAGGEGAALPDADKGGCQLLAGAAWRCCDHRRPAGGHLPGAGQAYRMTASAVAGRHHLEVVGGEDVHRVTAAASAAGGPGDLARRLATGTDGLSRIRGTAGAMTTAMAMTRPVGMRSSGSPG
jgi:hypothetical protein